MPDAAYPDDSDPDLPLDQDMDDDSADMVADMACPECGAAVIADTPKCPMCGEWIRPVPALRGNWRKWLFVAAVLLMLLATLRFTF